MLPPSPWLLAVRKKKLLHQLLRLWLHQLLHRLLLLKPPLAPLLLLLVPLCKLHPLLALLSTHPKMPLVLLKTLLALLKMLLAPPLTLPRRLLKPLLQRSNSLSFKKSRLRAVFLCLGFFSLN